MDHFQDTDTHAILAYMKGHIPEGLLVSARQCALIAAVEAGVVTKEQANDMSHAFDLRLSWELNFEG